MHSMHYELETSSSCCSCEGLQEMHHTVYQVHSDGVTTSYCSETRSFPPSDDRAVRPQLPMLWRRDRRRKTDFAHPFRHVRSRHGARRKAERAIHARNANAPLHIHHGVSRSSSRRGIPYSQARRRIILLENRFREWLSEWNLRQMVIRARPDRSRSRRGWRSKSVGRAFAAVLVYRSAGFE